MIVELNPPLVPQHCRLAVDMRGAKATVATALERLGGEVRGIMREGKLPPFVLAAVNGELVMRTQLADTPVGEGDVISVIAMMSGG